MAAPPAPTFSSPGNILIGSTTYAVPRQQNGQALTLAQIGPAGSANRQNIYAGAAPWGGTQIVADNRGYNIALNYNQNITDWLEFFGDSLWVQHHMFNYTSGSVNDVAAKVPNSNPFSPCNPGHYANGVVTGPADLMAACASGGLTVNYNTLSQIGPALSVGFDKGWSTTNGFHIKLPGDWQISPQVSLNQHNQWFSNATLTTPNPATYNYFCDATTFDCSMPGALGIIIPPYQGTAKAGPILSTGRFYQLQADGALFELPGGKVRLATGVEYDYWEAEKHTSTNTDPYKHDRAAYAELYIPIFGASNAIKGIRSLELDIAGRYDDYSDTGITRNPKVGVNWTPFQDLKLHASYGTSFRGAPIQNLGSLAPTFQTSTAAASAISPALCPRCTDPALYGVFGSNKLIYSEAMGNQNNLDPEKSTSYSFGFDWSPEALPGFLAGVNWWWIKYVNQVGNPESNAGGVGAINQQYYNEHLIYNPAFFPQLAANNPLAYMEMNPRANLADPNCAAVYQKKVTTQALFNSYVACANNNSGGQSITGTTSTNPNDVLAFTYYGQQNAGSTLADGFDLNASYAWTTDWGNWKANFVGEYIPRFDVKVIQGAPTVDQAGRFGYVLKFKSRMQLGWQRNLDVGALSANLFVNYSSKYKMDRGLLPNGVPESYGDIASRTTEDISIVYDTGSNFDSWLSKNISVMLSAQNITNSSPPLVINSTILFDPTYGWPPGRQIQLQIGKSW
ncbi:MAG: TonB-dependent receptor [Gammaproteobacteria bacterium]